MRFFFLFIISILQIVGQQRTMNKVQIASDEYDKFTSVGNLGLTITNFGILGNGWNKCPLH